ncbi:hypothetical protein Zmor_005749 [Zophobas morio]|uniref:Uncharacterized protein n=1 Tax=Zophobas morio TaxID=2755281 RepID=A0AA38ITH4_9CUCU|nr:hypothetical protein Zmor_005749 [Zophobas morio]
MRSSRQFTNAVFEVVLESSIETSGTASRLFSIRTQSSLMMSPHRSSPYILENHRRRMGLLRNSMYHGGKMKFLSFLARKGVRESQAVARAGESCIPTSHPEEPLIVMRKATVAALWLPNQSEVAWNFNYWSPGTRRI